MNALHEITRISNILFGYMVFLSISSTLYVELIVDDIFYIEHFELRVNKKNRWFDASVYFSYKIQQHSSSHLVRVQVYLFIIIMDLN